jgi:DNA-binding transcriptional regulator YiaG
MQTFVPELTFQACAEVLDWRRLGKQRVEVLQMASAILDPSAGWSSHPAVTMWRGHGAALLTYGLVVCDEWIGRGYRDTTRPKLVAMLPLMVSLGERIERPQWWGVQEVHDSHKAKLHRKDMSHYGQYFVYERFHHEYVWPEGRARKTPREERVSTKSQLVCQGCGRRPGFTNIGTRAVHWWVCGNCNRPTEAWMKGRQEVLNKFSGGPLAEMVYDSRTLLTDERLSFAVLGYRYTTEQVISPVTGAVARVWLYSAEGPDSVTTSAQLSASNPSSQGVNTVSTPDLPTAPELPDAPVADAAAPAEAAAPAAPAAPKEPAKTDDLEPLRKSLGLSRSKLAAASGLSEAKVYRIEKGGARTTEAEATLLRNALNEIKAAQPAEGEAPAAPAAETTEGVSTPQ